MQHTKPDRHPPRVQFIRAAGIPRIPASHEDPQDPGVLKQVLLAAGVLPEGRVRMVNWAYLAAGNAFTPHLHQDMYEVFVIADGISVMSAGTKRFCMCAGDALIVPPQTVHSMANIGTDECRYLVFGVSIGAGGRTIVGAP